MDVHIEQRTDLTEPIAIYITKHKKMTLSPNSFRIVSVPDDSLGYSGPNSASPVDRRRLAAFTDLWIGKGLSHSIYRDDGPDGDVIYFVNASSALKKVERFLSKGNRPAIVLGITEDVLTNRWAGAGVPLADIQEIAQRHFCSRLSFREFANVAANILGVRKPWLRRMISVIAKADTVICASEAQAASLRHINPFSVAIAEAIPEAEFMGTNHCQLDGLARQKAEEKSTYILWEGTAWGLGLIETIRKELEHLHSIAPTPIRLIVTMPQTRPTPFLGMNDNAEILARHFGLNTAFVPWHTDTIGDLVRLCDIGIAPMPLLNPFYAAKAHNKPAVYMSLGLPVVASDILAYRNLITHGVDGMIARDSKDWISCLLTLVADPNLRSVVGKSGKATFERKCATPVVADQFLAAFEQALTVAASRRSMRHIKDAAGHVA
jgi:hypothetical protein